MSQIPLHPTRGIDPHLTFCPRCGGEGRGLTIGHIKVASIHGSEHKIMYNRGQLGPAIRSFNKQHKTHFTERDVFDSRDLKENERVPDTDICDNCKEELEQHREIVAKGGIYFRCTQCGCEGVIKPNDFANHVRERLNIMAPDPCGVEFSKCVEHGVEDQTA